MGDKLHSMMVSSEERALIESMREKQIPELPTEPYTVIEVTWREEGRDTTPVLMRFPEEWYGEWGWTNGDDFGDARYLRREITGFKVLAKPTAGEESGEALHLTYGSGYRDGARAVLARWKATTAHVGSREREQITVELDEAQRAAQLEAIAAISKLDLDPDASKSGASA